MGRGEQEGVGMGGKKPLPQPLPLLLIFRTLSQFSYLSRALGKGKVTAATHPKNVSNQLFFWVKFLRSEAGILEQYFYRRQACFSTFQLSCTLDRE